MTVHVRFDSAVADLNYDDRIPCCCSRCDESDQPHFFPLTAVQRCPDGGTIQCYKSWEHVLAAELLKLKVRKESFVSYSWTGESAEIVDELEAAFEQRGIHLVRDRNVVRYRDPIRSFMNRIGRGKCIVVVISEAYLRSKSCMYEMVQIARHGSLLSRVFPIVLDDAGIFEVLERLDHVEYWENRIKQLDERMKRVEQVKLGGIREEIDLYWEIRGTIADVMYLIDGMNTHTTAEHRNSGFTQLCDAVAAKLAE